MLRSFLLLIMGTVLLSGCDFKSNSSSSATSTADTTAPTVSSTTPASSATNIDVDAAITITFSEGMLDSTINTTNITMVDSSSAAVTGTVTIDSDSLVATFTPSASLSYTETYTVSLSTSITDDSNNALASIYSWSFTTHSGTGAWNTATDQVSSSSIVYQPYDVSLVMDSNGNGMAIWSQGDGTANSSVFANYYTESTASWGTATEIDLNDTTDATKPDIGIDGSGNVMAVWQQSDGTAESIYYNIYTKSTSSWGTAALIDSTNNPASVPKVVMNTSGNAVAVWRQSDGTYQSIYSSTYTGTWSAQATLEAANFTAFEPSLAMNGDGDAVATWRQGDGTSSNIYAAVYAASTWGAATAIDGVATDASDSVPQVAINNTGNAVVLWRQNDGTTESMYANRYTNSSTSWGTAALVESSANIALDDFSVAIDSNSNAIALWLQSDGTAVSTYANRYTTSWGTAETIDTGNNATTAPHVAILPSNDAVAVWEQSDGTAESIYSSVYNGSWSTAATIESSTFSSTDPFVVTDRTGTKESALAAWLRTVGSVHSNLY
ncbi:hypothetical protein OA92_16670 [Marinomonas sp. SBI22]|uniref:Ig-like domain-containing protein n=1 Tax=unclassified Marinomonas TaxID=196814 RepID=UPI0007AFD684|nr:MULTISPECIES: Ig-like domain-containing protein [unclassified Marinomonas]KZM40647.1 hypothetical protein OA92_16670 [Marinomonas sp. SBI22]KZM42348.1 hypothetical protein OA91_14870 [Marinomonas sp. SBI8L]